MRRRYIASVLGVDYVREHDTLRSPLSVSCTTDGMCFVAVAAVVVAYLESE